MRDPGYAALMEKLNMPPKILGVKETVQHIDKMSKIWGEMVRVTGIREKEEQ
jgi:hypothetical protein